MRIVILQPFYLPYAGVFEMARMADQFVMFDDVQFMKQSWQTRNRIRVQNGTKWLSVPVRALSYPKINSVHISPSSPWADKHLKAIEHSYAGRPGIELVMETIAPILQDPPELLLDLNEQTFKALLSLLDIHVEIVRSSQLDASGHSSERVLNICKRLGATSYLSGPSAKDYLDEQSFRDAEIKLEYYRFDHPTYDQPFGEFIPSLSVVDLISCVGAEAGASIRGRGIAVPATSIT